MVGMPVGHSAFAHISSEYPLQHLGRANAHARTKYSVRGTVVRGNCNNIIRFIDRHTLSKDKVALCAQRSKNLRRGPVTEKCKFTGSHSTPSRYGSLKSPLRFLLFILSMLGLVSLRAHADGQRLLTSRKRCLSRSCRMMLQIPLR